MSRHTFCHWVLSAVLCLTVVGCGDDGESSVPAASSDGFVPRSESQARELQYLRFATAHGQPDGPLNAMAHMEREQREPTYHVADGAVPATAWDDQFAKMAALQDTRDFDALYLLNVLLGYRGNPMLAPGLTDKIEQALVNFKFWYTDPTPQGMLDNSYYWTENHEAIYHTLEYLMGQQYPDRVFGSDGKTGREHQARAAALLQSWFDLRMRFGFSEWHSNVYYQKDATPLLTLVEYADDPAIRTKAAAVLDVLLLDIGVHTFRGAFGTTHGRSYKKDKLSSLDDDTQGLVKLLFDTTEYEYQSTGDPGAMLFARAKRYRLPQVIFDAARSPETFVDRERMGIALNELGPVEANPQAPYGLSFTDPKDLSVWWGMSALTAWQVVPLTVQTLEQYNLWETANFAPFSGLQTFTGDLAYAQTFAASAARMLSFGLLKEVNTYTYRNADYMLSSAQSYRNGSFASQVHSWQATLDPNAIVFTTHPFRALVKSLDWYQDTETGSYWTGEASMPRTAQHNNVAIHIYAPQYRQKNPGILDFFHYEPYTHAYFPQDHFDEVRQQGPWTIGRFRDGYVALYSYRPAEWLVYDPTVYATNGMVKPFDLVANGGADNVWIVECGRKADFGSFDAFVTAISQAQVDVTVLPTHLGFAGGFNVVYQSPSQGHVTFGWEAPFTVKGAEVALTDYPRHASPFASTPFNSKTARIEKDGVGVQLDIERPSRLVYGR